MVKVEGNPQAFGAVVANIVEFLPLFNIVTPQREENTMLQPGLMMDQPLLLSSVIEHAAAQYGDVEIVSRETHGPLFRYTYADCAKRARKLAHALGQLGLSAGSAVGSIAWNNHRHLEAYYAVSGSGMVMHTATRGCTRSS
jgi:acyl-CoA synthetase (AMP-forming)/AMP-acid ligase II